MSFISTITLPNGGLGKPQAAVFIHQSSNSLNSNLIGLGILAIGLFAIWHAMSMIEPIYSIFLTLALFAVTERLVAMLITYVKHHDANSQAQLHEGILSTQTQLRDGLLSIQHSLAGIKDFETFVHSTDAINYCISVSVHAISVKNTVLRYGGQRLIASDRIDQGWLDAKENSISKGAFWTEIISSHITDYCEHIEHFQSLGQRNYNCRFLDDRACPMLQMTIFKLRGERTKEVIFGWEFPGEGQGTCFLTRNENAVSYFENYFNYHFERRCSDLCDKHRTGIGWKRSDRAEQDCKEIDITDTRRKHIVNDAYDQMNRLYLSLIAPSAALGLDVADPVMGDWIQNFVPDGAFILDAGCGLGFDMIALHKGLPARRMRKTFQVFGVDCSASMLHDAIKRGTAAGVDQSHYKQSSIAALKDIQEWYRKFDCVMACSVIYTFPEEVGYEHYDEYLLSCMHGFDSVLRPGGSLLLNTRNWHSFLAMGKKIFEHINEHEGEQLSCRYEWEFDSHAEGHHKATLTMRNCTTGESRATQIHFAGRTQEALIELFYKAGFQTIESKCFGAEDEQFVTFILCRHADATAGGKVRRFRPM